MAGREGWRAHLMLFLYFPGLIALAFVVEQVVLAPRRPGLKPARNAEFWRDFAGNHGMQIFDLNQLVQ